MLSLTYKLSISIENVKYIIIYVRLEVVLLIWKSKKDLEIKPPTWYEWYILFGTRFWNPEHPVLYGHQMYQPIGK